MLKSTTVLVLVAAFIAVTGNVEFFQRLLDIYSLGAANLGFLVSTVAVLISFIVLLILPFNNRYALKPVLVVLLIAAALIGYYTDRYGVVMDQTMIQNLLETDGDEVRGLLNVDLFVRMAALALIPSLLVMRLRLRPQTSRARIVASLRAAAAALALIAGSVAVFGGHYASFIREHKPVRYYTNPTYAVYGAFKFFVSRRTARDHGQPITQIATDAQIPASDVGRELVILVVGETARVDRFSLNGYSKKTNPRLEQEDNLISFRNMQSCGTATAQSLPCMFAFEGRAGFDVGTADDNENVLDVLKRAGVDVLWRDNNSGSKGVADRVAFEDFRSPANNPLCDEECRDEGMLSGLQDYVDRHSGDILIVLHQMGSHGPEYDKRYPNAFRVFAPVCASNELSSCSSEQINNAYDNTIVYTDHFIAEAIDLLKRNADKFETALFYISDHGESLGEHGLYLHGMPYLIAPNEQTHVAAMIWVGAHFDVASAAIAVNTERPVTHEELFHTLLDMFEVETSLYAASKSLLRAIEQTGPSL